MKTVSQLVLALAAALVVLVVPRRLGAPARQLHGESLRSCRPRRQHGLRPLRARPRRDPDVPGWRRVAAPATRPARAGARAARRRRPRAARRPLAPHFGATGRGRAEDDALRRGLPRRGARDAADLRRPCLRESHRLEEIIVSARDGARVVGELGGGDEPVERAPRLPERPPALASRRPQRHRRLPAGNQRRLCPHDRPDHGSGASQRRASSPSSSGATSRSA